MPNPEQYQINIQGLIQAGGGGGVRVLGVRTTPAPPIGGPQNLMQHVLVFNS